MGLKKLFMIIYDCMLAFASLLLLWCGFIITLYFLHHLNCFVCVPKSFLVVGMIRWEDGERTNHKRGEERVSSSRASSSKWNFMRLYLLLLGRWLQGENYCTYFLIISFVVCIMFAHDTLSKKKGNNECNA